MRLHTLSNHELTKAIVVGVGTALFLSAIMVPAFMAGIPPMPKPPSLAFAEVLYGGVLPLPVGIVFHIVYVTTWSVIFVSLFRGELAFMRALALALVLWVVALVVFFPIVGWGLLGLAVSQTLIPAALVPHLLFAVGRWGLCRVVFGAPRHAAR